MNSEQNNQHGQQQDSIESCSSAMSRKQFVAAVVKRGAIAGALFVIPAIVDTFIVPPKAAFAMTNTMNPMMP